MSHDPSDTSHSTDFYLYIMSANGNRRADGIQLQGKILSVSFDLDGSHYKQGKGLQVFVNGKLAKSSPTMAKLELQL
jgi:hypothetical protein